MRRSRKDVRLIYINFIERLPEKEAIHYFYEISNGLDTLYDKGIYHRDVKPENILIGNGKMKLADFGFAKVITGEKKNVA